LKVKADHLIHASIGSLQTIFNPIRTTSFYTGCFVCATSDDPDELAHPCHLDLHWSLGVDVLADLNLPWDNCHHPSSEELIGNKKIPSGIMIR
jgi:hypothetical protein